MFQSSEYQGWVKNHNWAFAALHNGPNIGGYTKVRQVAQTYRVFGTPTFFFVDMTRLI